MPQHFADMVEFETIFVSAKRKENINLITDSLLAHVNLKIADEGQTLVTNTRHYEALLRTSDALEEIKTGLQNNLPGDLIASDLRNALYHLGTISGEVSNDEILGNIFANFCIGK
jgi:tRNA modification GTPase